MSLVDELCSRSGGDAREAMTVGCKPTTHWHQKNLLTFINFFTLSYFHFVKPASVYMIVCAARALRDDTCAAQSKAFCSVRISSRAHILRVLYVIYCFDKPSFDANLGDLNSRKGARGVQ